VVTISLGNFHPQQNEVEQCAFSSFLINRRLVTLAIHVVSGDPSPSVKKGDDGYADYILTIIHDHHEHLGFTLRKPFNTLHEMHGLLEKDWFNINKLSERIL